MTVAEEFRFQCYKILPLVYDDTLSYYELLCKVVKTLNNVIQANGDLAANDTALINAYHQLENYVNNYFDNLDIDEIKEEILSEATVLIRQIMNDLIRDGILAQYVPNSVGELTLNYIGSLTYTNQGNPPEGFTVINGTTGVWYGLVSAYPERSTITTFNVQSGTVLQEVTINLGHGNDLAYDGSYLYCIDSEQDANGKYRIFKLSYPNINLITTWTSDYPLKGLDYYDGTMYVYSDGMESGTYRLRWFTLNRTTGALTQINTATFADSLTHLWQGCVAFNGKLYTISTNPEALNVWSLSGDFLSSIPLPKYNNEGIYNGEFQGMGILSNGNLCSLSAYVEHLNENPFTRDRERAMIVNELNPDHNLTAKYGIRERNSLAENVITLHVDNHAQNYKGTGYSGNPFSSMVLVNAYKNDNLHTIAVSLDNVSRNPSVFISNRNMIVNVRVSGCTICPYFADIVVNSRFSVNGSTVDYPYSIDPQYSNVKNVRPDNITNVTYRANNFLVNVGNTVQDNSNIHGIDTYVLVGGTNQIPLYSFAKITVNCNTAADGTGTNYSGNFVIFTEASVQTCMNLIAQNRAHTMSIRLNRIGSTNFVEVTNAYYDSLSTNTELHIMSVTWKALHIEP